MSNRQRHRRELFQAAFTAMPLWEVWEVEPPTVTPQYDPDKIDAELLALYPHPNKVIMGGSVTIDQDGKVVPRKDFSPIPRRLRRIMARAKTAREWIAIRGE